jgi:hypothetical protein
MSEGAAPLALGRGKRSAEARGPPERLAGVLVDLAEVGEPLSKRLKDVLVPDRRRAEPLFSTDELQIEPSEPLGEAAEALAAQARGARKPAPSKPAAPALVFGADLENYQGVMYHDKEGRFYHVGEFIAYHADELTPEGAEAEEAGVSLKNNRRNNENYYACGEVTHSNSRPHPTHALFVALTNSWTAIAAGPRLRCEERGQLDEANADGMHRTERVRPISTSLDTCLV